MGERKAVEGKHAHAAPGEMAGRGRAHSASTNHDRVKGVHGNSEIFPTRSLVCNPARMDAGRERAAIPVDRGHCET
ncbi:hypothetical protein LBMAG47_13380 [Planctomycetia bacterium]|nr:hypothetical protein LBMAG47_13380 [Planctomycetia bacterium]